FRCAQSRRSSPPHHYGKLRLYPALPSIAECSEAAYRPDSRADPRLKGVCHNRSSRTLTASPSRGSRFELAARRRSCKTPVHQKGSPLEMNPFDEKPPHSSPDDQPAVNRPSDAPREESPQETLGDLGARIVVHPPEPVSAPPSSDAMSFAADTSCELPPPPPANAFLPEDLRVPWSWLHLLLFGLFAFGSILVIQIALVVYFNASRHLSPKEIEQLFQNRPDVAVGSNVLWFFLIFLFLYVTIAALQGRPFWPTFGWKKLGANPDWPVSPWVYLAGGAGLAVCVAIASTKIKTPDHLPIQDLFKNRTGAFLLMGMAVLIAPLVEETVFRGYLYPLF